MQLNNLHLIIKDVVKLTLDGNFKNAEMLLKQIDYEALIIRRKNAKQQLKSLTKQFDGRSGIKRINVREIDKLNTFTRDNYCCRYKHCQQITIDSSVLRELSRIYPKTFPYQRNWNLKVGKSLILYWYYVTSLEHITSFPNGGNSETSNLITACYYCNDSKNKYSLEALGWEITEPSNLYWRGLTEYVPQLKQISNFINEDLNNNLDIENEVTKGRLKNSLSALLVQNRIQTQSNNIKEGNTYFSTDDLINSQIPVGSILQSKSSGNSILLFGIKDNRPLLASTKIAWCVQRKNTTATYYKVIIWGNGKLPQGFSDPEHQKCLEQAEKYLFSAPITNGNA